MSTITTYYTAKTAEGKDTPAQAAKLGTSGYGYPSIAMALRYTPEGGYVESRHTSGGHDWAGEIVASR